jgi:hypothetical protein
VASLTPTFFATSASRRVMASILVPVAQVFLREVCVIPASRRGFA